MVTLRVLRKKLLIKTRNFRDKAILNYLNLIHMECMMKSFIDKVYIRSKNKNKIAITMELKQITHSCKWTKRKKKSYPVSNMSFTDQSLQ